MASLKDIANICNVSVATVSKALNGYTDIGEETRDIIMKTAEKIGYMPNSSARALKTKRTYNLAVLFVDEGFNGLTHDYFNHVLDSFKNEAEEMGYDITFASRRISGQQISYLEHCRYRGVDGVVIACVDFSTKEVQELLRSDLPMVTIDHVCDGVIAIVSNNVQGMEKLVSFICDNGHKRIAYIHGERTSVTKSRMAGFFRIMQERNLQIPDEYILQGSYRNPDTAAVLTGRLLDLPVPPTCILYPDDYAAIGGINEIRERGLRIPDDISVVGFDGTSVAQIMDPKLTTLNQDTRSIGRMAAIKLIELIENPRTAIIEKYVVDGALFEGASVKNLNQ